MAYLIKSFHSPANGAPRRVHFWQTPWVVPTLDGYREVGGWMIASPAATKYDTYEEAEAVNHIRYLGGQVVEAERYLTPQPQA